MDSVSVVIPCFNQEAYLQEAVESVLAQGIKDLELIIVNDGSKAFNANCYTTFVVINNTHSIGAAASRNIGVRAATKEYLAFLDADDLWLPGKIAKQIEIASANPYNMIFSMVEQFISGEFSPNKDLSSRIKNKIIIGKCASSLLIKREIFVSTGGFKEDLELGEFIDWYLRAKKLNINEMIIPEVLVRRRIHKANNSYLNRHARNNYLRILHENLIESL